MTAFVETPLTENPAYDAKGDLIVGTGADVAARLAAGTDGQVLTADSAQATGLKYATPTVTSVASDTLFNAKGDLIVGTANDTATRLGVGTNGQVLTADSSQTTGAKWATPSASGGNVATDTIFDAKGDLVAGSGADTAVRVPVGSNGYVLSADSAQSGGVGWVPPTVGGAGVGFAVLTGATVIGATTVVVDTVMANMYVGQYVGVGAGTNACEIRRITAINSGTKTLTLDSAMKIAHGIGANVWVSPGRWIPLEWWGAIADPTRDSYRSVINALIDQNGTNYGLSGHNAQGNAYGISRPIFINDNGSVDFAVKAVSWALDAATTFSSVDSLGIPYAYGVVLAGDNTTATFNASTDQVTVAVSIGSTGADAVFYPRQGSTLPGGIEEGRRYFTLSSGTTFQVALTPGGSAIDITSAGSGEIICISTQLARLNGRLDINMANTKAMSGLLAWTQQPQEAQCRIESCPVIGATLAADQGHFPNIEVINGWCGVEMAGYEIGSLVRGNIEQCDINVWLAPSTRFPTTSFAAVGMMIDKFHFEAAGNGNSQIQTLQPSGSLTGGAFQLRFKNVLTSSIAYNVTAAGLQTILQAHSAIGSGNVTCTQLTGTNLSDGMIQCDFTVGALNWEHWSGSTNTTTGGVLAVVSSTLTGGTIAVNTCHPQGANIKFDTGRAVFVKDTFYGSTGVRGDGTKTPFLETTGRAIDPTLGPTQGYVLENLYSAGTGIPWVRDSFLLGGELTTDDSNTGQILHRFVRPSNHGGVSQVVERLYGYAGRREQHNALGAPFREYYAGTGQTDDHHAWYGPGLSTAALTVTKDALLGPRASAAPTSGTHIVGEIVYNSAPTASGTIGWVCVSAGTPGTWKTFGAISA